MSSLTRKDYQIVGNDLDAYYDAAGRLVFVIDNTEYEHKPNVLLVMGLVPGRKWDDVLANDYDVDLETIRPKKDNKYQKLDIEYDGLAIYDALIRAYENGDDVSASLAQLMRFRVSAAKRAASVRLAAAEETIEKSRETIEKTNDTISELTARVKQLRAKLSQQKKSIGREPTKQSASKILKTEAQIDATNEKLRRAQRRLSNAQKRLLDADADADVARAILAALASDDNVPQLSDARPRAVASPAPTDMVAVDFAPVPAVLDEDDDEDEEEPVTDLTQHTEPKAEIMADEEVKPLFDTDPEILDEEIAFKPIEFDASPIQSPVPVSDGVSMTNLVAEDVPVPGPVEFVPPVAMDDTAVLAPIDVRPVTDMSTPVSAPVLDTLTPVNDSDAFAVANAISESAPAAVEFTVAQRPAPVMPAAPANPLPDVAPAPADSPMRPISPVSGNVVATDNGAKTARPTMIYYVMLLVLIVMSVFTLWLYQRNTGETVPDLAAATEIAAPAQTDTESVPAVDSGVENPFLANAMSDAANDSADVSDETLAETVPAESIEVEAEVVPVAQQIDEAPVVVEPVAPVTETVSIPAPEPVEVAVQEIAPTPVEVVVAEPEPEPVVESPFLSVEPVVDVPAVETPEPVPTPVVNKPAYNVSQQENMFVSEYDYVAEPQYVNETPDVQYVADTDGGQYMDEQVCSDGRAPDANGCCGMEIFTDMEDGTYACCAPGGMECFPPMN